MNVIVGIVYRPPVQNSNDFLCDLDIVFLLGDLNVNLMNHSEHQATSLLFDTLYSKMFFPLILRLTRITAHKASLIENIFTNAPLSLLISGLFINDISHHLPVFAFTSEKYRVSNPERYITFRVKNKNNLRQFQEELESLDWNDVHQSTASSEAYKLYIDKYNSAYNRSFPLKKSSY